CIAFSHYLKIKDEDRELLAIAGLFHDIGFSRYEVDSQEIFLKQLDTMTLDEVNRYKEHPRLGAEILQDKEFANADLIELIMTHEERRNGNGFPNKLQKLKTNQEILAICALYDSYLTLYKK